MVITRATRYATKDHTCTKTLIRTIEFCDFSSLQPRDERPVKHVHVITRSCNFYYKL